MNNSRRCNRGASTITKQLALQERFYSLCCSALLFGTIIFSTTNNNFIKLNKTSQFLKFNWSNFLPGAYSTSYTMVYAYIYTLVSAYIYIHIIQEPTGTSIDLRLFETSSFRIPRSS
jgi:hypothetical protein